MGKSYSSDLRERVLGYVKAGHSRRAAGLRFEVSASSAVRVLQRHEATGSVEPARQGRPPGGGKLAQHLDYLMACVQGQPDITLPELAARLQAERGVQVDPSSLSRRLRAAGYSYKKNADGSGTRAQGRSRGAPDLDRSPPAADAA